MPNWVSSRIKVSGDIARFASKFNETGGTPLDERFPHRALLGRFCDVSVAASQDEIKIFFDTAWGPAIEWIDRAASEWPEASFELAYCEMGMEFYGVVTHEHGQRQTTCFDQGVTTTVTTATASTGPFWPAGMIEEDDWTPSQHVTDHIEKHDIGLGG